MPSHRSHSGQPRRRAYPTRGSAKEPREGREYGTRGTKQKGSGQQKEAK